MKLDLIKIKREMITLLQESNETRPLDSLETMVIKSYLNSLGLTIGFPEFLSVENTIERWLEWLHQYSNNGQSIS